MVAKKHMKTFFLLVFTDLWLCTAVMHEKTTPDSLKPGDMLIPPAKLCSPRRVYCLDFVEMPSGSGLNYLQISNENTIWWIWLANAEEPFVNNSGVLTLDHLGVLQIKRQGRDPLVLFSPPSPNRANTKATLLDSGNFVLQELHPDGSIKSMLWQSFDHPTDTLVAGMKLGLNHKTGHRWFLVSAVSGTIFSSGPFTLEWDPKMGRLIILHRGQIYWTSGVLNENRRFQYIPEGVQSVYEYTIVSNKDEDYFTYKTVSDGGVYPPQWALYDNGQLVDGRGNDIARADKCYGYNTDGGCERWKLPSCRHAGQVFDVVSGYLDNSGSSNASVKSYDTNTSLSISDCQASCWSNCDCVGFSSNFDNGTGCIFYEGSWVFVSFARGGNSLFLLKGMFPGHKGKLT